MYIIIIIYIAPSNYDKPIHTILRLSDIDSKVNNYNTILYKNMIL